MGIYIEPQYLDGAPHLEWLWDNAEPGEPDLATFRFDDTPPGCLPVILLRNPGFVAAVVVTDRRELVRFTRPEERRPRKLFFVRREKILTVTYPHTHRDLREIV